MASRNQRSPVPIPAAGVRRDFDALEMPENALESGVNVIVRNGVLVPRPATKDLNWFYSGSWQPMYESNQTISIGYDSANTQFVVGLDDGRMVVTTDAFATIAVYANLGVNVPGPAAIGLVFDATNSVWIALCEEGSIYTAPNTWPGSGSWTHRLDGSSGTGYQIEHDQASGITCVLTLIGGDTDPQVLHSGNGITWSQISPAHLAGNMDAGYTTIGIGGQGKPDTILYVITRKDRTWDYLLNLSLAQLGVKAFDDAIRTLINDKRSNIVGGGTTTCSLVDDGSETLVQSSTNSGSTWTDRLGSGDPYQSDRFTRLFYDSSVTEKYLCIGKECHKSADGASWTEYPPPAIDPTSVTDAVSDGTDWFIVGASGVLMVPSEDLASSEKIVSMFQMDTDGVPGQLFCSTEGHIRKLNANTGEWTDLAFDSSPAVSFDISSDPRGLRTVFRSFECEPPGVSGYKHVLLMTNPQLDLSYWFSSAATPQVTYCAATSTHAPGSKVLLTAANRVVLANGPSGSEHGVDASDALDIANGWNGLNLAILADTPGKITAGMELSALQFALFKEDCVYHGIAQTEFAGVATAFRYEMVRTGIQGPVAPHSLLRTPMGSLCYLGQDGGVYLYEGGAPQDLGVHVRRIIADQMDFDNKDHAWGYVDPIERTVHFFFQTVAGNMNRGVTIDLESGAAWELQLPSYFQAACGGPMFITKDLTWADFSVAWSDMTAAWNSFQSGYYYVAIGSENDIWGYQEWGDVDDYTDLGTPITVFWTPGWAPLGNADMYATWLEMRHQLALFHDGQELIFTASSLDSQFDQQSEDDDDALTTETGEYTTEFDVSGMLFRYAAKGSITRKFVWGGGINRFRQRGEV